jgi:NDP-sugar pyrophosphorylase family protein
VKVLVPMAGDSQRFEESGYQFPKNLVEIEGKPLMERVLRQLDDLGELVCIVREEESRSFHTADAIRLLAPEAAVVEVPTLESGAACTALLAAEEIDPDAPLLVFNGDQIVRRDLSDIVADFERRGLDGGVVVFQAVHPRWSYVKTDDEGLVVEAAEKRPISMQATAGTYWYRRGSDFVEALEEMILKDAHVDGRFYICPAFNEMVLRQARIGTYEIEPSEYFSLASPQGVELYAEHLASRRGEAA